MNDTDSSDTSNSLGLRLFILAAILECSSLIAQDFYLSTDVPVSLGGTIYTSNQIVANQSKIYSLQLDLSASLAIQALSSRGSNAWLFVPSCSIELGGQAYTSRQVVLWRSNTYSLFFDATNLIPAYAQIDGLCEEPGTGYLIFSTDVPMGNFTQNDLIRWDGTSLSTAWDAESFHIPPSTNIMGFHLDACDHIFFSFDVPTKIGSATYLPGEIVQWNGSAFSLFYNDTVWPLSAQMNGLTLTPFPKASAAVSGNTLICLGESAVIRADLTGTPPWNLTWSDGFVQTGVTVTPVLRSVSPTINTGYALTAFNDVHCEGERTGRANVLVNGTFSAAITPAWDNQGLVAGQFTVETACDIQPTTVQWTVAPHAAFTTSPSGYTLTLSEPPGSLKTTVTATVIDSSTRSERVVSALFLTSQNTFYYDFNRDGCNSLSDLWRFAHQYWRTAYLHDPDGSGFVDIRDLLYLNLNHPGGCN